MQSVSLRQLRRRRWGVRAALVLGIVASVAANVLHAEPNTIARVISSWPPVAILIALELVSRVPATGWLGRVRNVALAVVAAIAAWVSYWHMAGVAARYGESDDAAHLLPISVDGLIVVASVSLVILSAQIRTVEQAPAQAAPEQANPTPAAPVAPLVSLVKAPAQPVTGDASEPAMSGFSPKGHKAMAFMRLLNGDDAEQIATDHGISTRTLQRWADEIAAKTRKPRGGPRKTTPEPSPEPVPVGTTVEGR